MSAVVATTWLWVLAYMNVYTSEDVRLQASEYMRKNIPFEAPVLVEPTQNIPPVIVLDAPIFHHDYVGFGALTMRADYYFHYTLDVYLYLYDLSVAPADKSAYIAERLALVDYIVMDDSFLEFYEHLNDPSHAPVRKYYDDLFGGRLGFTLIKTFRVKPSIFGVTIDDEAAEMTFALFDHPEIFVFKRRVPRENSSAHESGMNQPTGGPGSDGP